MPTVTRENKPRPFAIACAALTLALGCAGSLGCTGTLAEPPINRLRLATTTSTRDSGLLDTLLPVFEAAHQCQVDVVAVGTGAALKLGEAGDVDVLLVHARDAEEAFMAAGHGVRHEEFMANNFVLLGPQDDPAKIRDLAPVEAMRRIAEVKHRFISRGDDSGTHQREMSLWQRAGGRPDWGEYLECGQGMGVALVMAHEKQGYVLSDMGTYLNFREKIELVPLAASAPALRNPYAAIVVNSQQTDNSNAALANTFVDFLISDRAQKMIANHKIDRYPLFTPTRLEDGN